MHHHQKVRVAVQSADLDHLTVFLVLRDAAPTETTTAP